LAGRQKKAWGRLGGAGWAWWLWEWLCDEVLLEIDRKVVPGLCRKYHLPLLAMSEEQLLALLAKLKDDAGLQEKLKGAVDLDAAVAMAKEAGFDVKKADWLRYQASQTLELSDEELESASGGGPTPAMSTNCISYMVWYCPTYKSTCRPGMADGMGSC
jgi:predicted ribosomally synthesized peptide with nif11-like leader